LRARRQVVSQQEGRLGRALALLLLLCACKRDPVQMATGELSAPAALHFGSMFVGYPAALTLEVDDRGQSGRHATVSVAAPFSVDHDGLDVPGGGSASVNVSFVPTAPGPASAVLTIATDDQTLTVMLDGTGMAQPVCTPSAACRDSRFVLDAGACVETVSPDKTPCTSQVACLDSAECLGGECVGQAAICTDGNACTEDACDLAAGCIHFDVSARCPEASDPCHAASCDVDAGCGITEAPDGTLCGPHDCTTASVCLAGVCKPNVGVPEGFECVPATPCQAAGRCHSHVCVQPPPQPLVAAWTYDPSPTASIYAAPFTDAQGNAYWFEYGNQGQELVSATPQGFIRYRIDATFDSFRYPFLVGDVLVAYLDDGTYDAFSAHDGGMLWHLDLRVQGASIIPDPGLIVGATHASAQGSAAVWFVYQMLRANESRAVVGARGPIVSAVDPHSGALLWATRIRDAGFLEGIGPWTGGTLDNTVADEADDLYVALSDPVPEVNYLVSLSSAGVMRWGRKLPAAPSAAYGARVAVVPLTADAGPLGSLSAIDGTNAAALELKGLTIPPVLAVFDGAAAAAIAPLDAGAPYGDCNDQLVPYALFAWDLTTGAMRQHTLVGPGDTLGRQSSVMLLDDRSLLMPDGRGACLADGGIGDRIASLRRVSLDGTEIFSCELPGAFYPFAPMGGTRWVTAASPVDHTIIEAFDLPGVVPAAHGWITEGGNPGGGDAPR
jgi:hypothetical protein